VRPGGADGCPSPHLFIYAGIAAVGVGVQLTLESTFPGADAATSDGARLVLCAGAALRLAALRLAALAFIAWTTSSLRDRGVRARLLAAASVVAVAAIESAAMLPAPVVAAGVLAIVVGLTAWQERSSD